jgi:hypothetical protein
MKKTQSRSLQSKGTTFSNEIQKPPQCRRPKCMRNNMLSLSDFMCAKPICGDAASRSTASQLHRTGRRRTVQHDRLGDRRHCGTLPLVGLSVGMAAVCPSQRSCPEPSAKTPDFGLYNMTNPRSFYVIVVTTL